jgi:hypothetical protein
VKWNTENMIVTGIYGGIVERKLKEIGCYEV